jgi:hypothetical protein
VTYSFACPVPCDYKIKVHAKNHDDAVNAIIRGGAIRCRNSEKDCHCDKARLSMPPMPREQLKSIVQLCMKEEYDASRPHASGQMI